MYKGCDTLLFSLWRQVAGVGRSRWLKALPGGFVMSGPSEDTFNISVRPLGVRERLRWCMPSPLLDPFPGVQGDRLRAQVFSAANVV